MEGSPERSSLTRKELAHAVIDFLDGTKQRLDQLSKIDHVLSIMKAVRPLSEMRPVTENFETQAAQAANAILQALGGVSISLPSDKGGSPQTVRLNALQNFTSPEGAPTWLISSSPRQFGEVTMDFSEARARLQE